MLLVADDCLRAVRDVDVLHRHPLFAARPVFSQGLDLGRKCPGELVEPGVMGLDLGNVLGVRQPSRRTDRCDVRCRHLHRKHALDRITRGKITDHRQHEAPLIIAGVLIAGLVRLQGLQAMAQKGVRLHLVRRAEYGV